MAAIGESYDLRGTGRGVNRLARIRNATSLVETPTEVQSERQATITALLTGLEARPCF